MPNILTHGSLGCAMLPASFKNLPIMLITEAGSVHGFKVQGKVLISIAGGGANPVLVGTQLLQHSLHSHPNGRSLRMNYPAKETPQGN